ncbi:MAG: ribonuclease HII [Endomicrobium sp.]|jgi:ribonuclease HII|nr:ribonuclease HII [Endomicrobium sp.]
MDLFSFDRDFYGNEGVSIAGVDEAGRGPLAGPVVAAAVILRRNLIISGLNDSKQLSEKNRERLFVAIKEEALDYSVEVVDSKIIDKINILQATFLAMSRAVSRLQIKPAMCIVDGNREVPNLAYVQKAIVDGDAKSASIAAASILAKVTRDKIMVEYAKRYPVYGFEKHKGYGTRKHIKSLKQYGICPIHRVTFSPISDIISQVKFGI